MAFQPINYAALPTDHPYSGLVEALMQGAQIHQQNELAKQQNERAQHQDERLQAREPLQQALLRAQAERQSQGAAPQLSPFEKASQGHARIVQQFGEDSPQAKQSQQYLDKLSQGTAGITVLDPKTGQPMVKIGGTGSSQRGDGGTVYQSGDEQVSPLSRTSKSTVEKSLIASKQVDILADKFKDIGKTKGAWNKATNFLEQVSNEYLGGNYDTPSDLQYIKSSMNAAVEPLIREMGLNATDKTIAEVTGIIEPKSGESASGYKKRITNQLRDFSSANKGKSDFLFEGIRREAPGSESKMVKILSPYGGLHLVPEGQVPEALKRGGKRV